MAIWEYRLRLFAAEMEERETTLSSKVSLDGLVKYLNRWDRGDTLSPQTLPDEAIPPNLEITSVNNGFLVSKNVNGDAIHLYRLPSESLSMKTDDHAINSEVIEVPHSSYAIYPPEDLLATANVTVTNGCVNL